MTQLLVIREYIKNFYTKYEEFIVPLLKFVLGLHFASDDQRQNGLYGKN